MRTEWSPRRPSSWLRIAAVAAITPALFCGVAAAASVDPPAASPGALTPALLAGLDLADGSIQSLVPVLHPDGSLTVALRLGEQAVTISASPRSMRSPSFALVVASAGEGRGAPEAPGTVIDAPPSKVYRGVVVGAVGSVASLSVHNGQVRGVVRLPSPDGAQLWGVQPLADVDDSLAPADLHMVYRAEQIVAPPSECGGGILPEGFVPAAEGEGGVAGDGPCNQLCQIAIDADVEFYIANGSSIENTLADIELIMDGVEAIFFGDVGINYLITTIKIRTVEPDPYTSTASSTLLAEFKDWWNGNEQGVVRDVAHLFTGKNLNGTTIGIAYLSVVCSPTQSYGLTQSKWSTNVVLRTATTAHELGHNWSAPHCNNDPECAIMCSGITGCSGEVTFFEQGTKNTIINYRDNASCLGPGPQAPPTANDDVLFAAADASNVLDVIANDLELNCDPLTVFGLPAATAAGGSVVACATCAPDGGPAVAYTPPPGFSGSDSFSYSIKDPSNASDSASVALTVLALRVPENPSTPLPGLQTDIYLLPPLNALPDFSQLTPIYPFVFNLIYFPATTGELFYTGQSDNVGAVFSGFLNAPTSDFYTLYLEASDGAKLWIGDTLVVDNDGVHDVVEKSGVVGLQEGKHAIRVEYFDKTGVSAITARWKSSTIAKAIIPSAEWSWTLPPVFGDLNGDQKVNGADLGALLSQWGADGTADLNEDGVVNGADLGALLAAWTG